MIFSEFSKDSLKKTSYRFEVVPDEYRKHKDVDIILPHKSTQYSAGYDFHTPCDINIYPGETKMIWSDVCLKIPEYMYLMMVVRSSVGFKKHLMLANTAAIIDADYYGNPDNYGNIGIPLYNYGTERVQIQAGDRIVQGLLLPVYSILDEEIPQTKRTGGFGSTDVI